MKVICHFYLYSFRALEIIIIFLQKVSGPCLEKRRQNPCPCPTPRWQLRLILANGTTFILTARNLLATGLHWQRKKSLMAKISCMRDRYINLQKLRAIKSLFLSRIQAKD